MYTYIGANPYTSDGFTMVENTDDIITPIKERGDMQGNWRFSYSVKVSMLEIYNETVR
jgi:hypothetical protein